MPVRPDRPLVSVLVPTYRSAAVLPGCLEAIAAQDYDGEVEVLVADGGSDDGTRELCEAEPRVRLVDNPDRTQAAGLNRAAGAARGEVLVRCDAQSRLPADALRRFVAEHERAGRLNVGGRQVALPPGTAFGDAVASVYNTRLGSGGAAYRVAAAPVAGQSRANPVEAETVYLGSWRKADWQPFDPAFLANQDTEHNVRWRRAGGRVLVLPDIAVGYLPRDSWRALARQYARYGFWRARTFKTHRDLGSRQLAALMPVATVLAVAGTPWTPWAALPALGYLAAVAVSGLLVDARAAVRLRAPLALATMHLAWGAGFVAGLLTPWRP
jgi:succinoglycan biosynthesis protein ExoA